MNNFKKLGVFKSKGRFFKDKTSKYRSPFQRDRDRIIHSASFRRLKHKTQVFVNTDGDHYRTRMTHSLEVAQIARSISKYLNLNDDLAETLSLAHDLGHTPFGHAGEEVLNDCMINHGGFDHNLQTLRIVMFIEKKYIDFDGLNLSFETLDGLIKHNGPIKDLSKLENIIGIKLLKNKFKLNKFSCLESQISNIADDIAYNNHGIQDGLKAGLFTLEELLEINFFKDIYKKYKDKKKIELQVLIHQIIRDSIDLMVKDIINNTIQNIKKNKIKKLNNVFDNKQKTVEFSDKLKDIIREEFQNIKNMMNFDRKSHEIFRNWYIDGRIFYHKVIDLKDPASGIQEIRNIDPLKIRLIRKQEKGGPNSQSPFDVARGGKDPTNPESYKTPEVEEYYLKTHRPANPSRPWSRSVGTLE